MILNRGGLRDNKEIVKILNTINPNLKSSGFANRHVMLVLRSHGLIPIPGLENINFQALQALLCSYKNLKSGSNSHKSEEFFNPKDEIQKRLEMFRSVYYDMGNVKISSREAAKTCQLSKAQFFNIKKLFDDFGVLGLLSMNRGRISKHKLTPEIETKIVLKKIHDKNLDSKTCPTWVYEEFGVKVTRNTIDNVFSFWFGSKYQINNSDHVSIMNQSNRDIPHVSTAKSVSINDDMEKKKESTHHQYGLSFPVPQVEMLFVDIMKWLGQGNTIEISRPGLFLMATYLRRLGIYECFESLVRKGVISRTVFYAVITNINRILGGLCTINRLKFETDLSIPLVSGLGTMLSPKTIHKGLEELSPETIHYIKLDVARSARELGLINGRKSAFDFHFIIFHGDDADIKGFSKGPSKKGVCLPGHRPHIWWDLGTNTIGFIYYCKGKERAAKTVIPFLHTCVFEVIDPEMLKEVFMDSEYTSFDIFNYMADPQEVNADVTMCMRSNAIRKFVLEKIENGEWKSWEQNDKYEICSARVILEDISQKVHLVLKRKIGKTKFRVFLTTQENLTDEELLTEYGDRWGIENGIKDLVVSYFIDQVPSNSDPVKIDAHFYCVMAAKLAVDLFIKDIGGFLGSDRNNSKRTLHSLRDIFFTGKAARLTRDKDLIKLTYHDGIQADAWDLLMQLQESHQLDILNNAIPWWGGMRQFVDYKNQLPDNLRGPLKSVKLTSADFLAEDIAKKSIYSE